MFSAYNGSGLFVAPEPCSLPMETSRATFSAAQACDPAPMSCVITHLQQFADLHEFATLNVNDATKLSNRVHDFVLVLDPRERHIDLLAGFLETHPYVAVHIR